MALQNYYSGQFARTESPNRAVGEAEPVVKGESPPRPDRETSRVASDATGPPIIVPKRKARFDEKHKPSARGVSSQGSLYPEFRRLCDEIINELSQIDEFFIGDEVSDEGLEVVVEIEELLERLYSCPYGKGESLKRVVVAIQTQVNNAQWARRHVEFLKEVIRFMRVRFLVDEAAVDHCYELIKAHDLDEFRGTVSEPQVVKHYRIEEVIGDAESSATPL